MMKMAGIRNGKSQQQALLVGMATKTYFKEEFLFFFWGINKDCFTSRGGVLVKVIIGVFGSVEAKGCL